MKRTKRKKRTSYGIEAVRAKVCTIQDLILRGTVLAIDPSCISTSSNPGWALYKNSKLHSSGIIGAGVDPRLPLERRLQILGKLCREGFEEPDVFCIEQIQMGGRINMQSTIRATGAILGNFETENVISISPLAWQSHAIKILKLEGNNDYEKYKYYKEHIKGDEEDAKWIGRMVIELAKETLN